MPWRPLAARWFGRQLAHERFAAAIVAAEQASDPTVARARSLAARLVLAADLAEAGIDDPTRRALIDRLWSAAGMHRAEHQAFAEELVRLVRVARGFAPTAGPSARRAELYEELLARVARLYPRARVLSVSQLEKAVAARSLWDGTAELGARVGIKIEPENLRREVKRAKARRR